MAAKEVNETITNVHLQEMTDQAPPSLGTLMDDTCNEVMNAVQDNDVEQLERILAGSSRRVDLNFMNSSGETPLQVAVKNKHTEIIQILLDNGATIGNALIQAIYEESLECVKLLLEFQEKLEKSSSASLNFERSDNELGYHTTPLILAAINNSYDIVKFLLSKGHFIDNRDLHGRTCECPHCEHEGRLGCSLRRLNVYRGLASPVYLSLSYLHETPKKTSDDPIIQAFLLNKELLDLSETEYEFKAEYKALSEQCEDFAVSLLNQCRNMSEIETLMNVPTLEDMKYVKVVGCGDLSKKLSVLNFAIKNNIKKFVAHSYSQMMLNTVLYKGFRSWEKYSAIKKILFGIAFSLLLPVWSIMFIFCPESHLSCRLNIPLLKFLAHTGSFCVFLVLLFLSSVQDVIIDPLHVSVIDCILIMWITGIALEEIKEFIRQGRRRYISQFWNIITIMMLFLFFISGLLWVSGYALSNKSWAISLKDALGVSKEGLKAYQLILLSNSFFAMAFLLAFLHISNTFQVNSVMGPLQLSLIKMTRDVLKFLFLFILIYIAFTMAIRKVYSQFVWVEKSFSNHTSEQGFSSILGSMRLTFWAVFDKTELDTFKTSSSFPTKITQNTGEVLFAFFNITIILVAINMLIAMMSNSFQSIEDDADIQWKFSRTHMWMQFIDKGSVLPPPFNILPTVTDIIHLFRLLFTRKICPQSYCSSCCDLGWRDVSEERRVNNNIPRKRGKLITHLIQRHFYNLEKDRDQGEKILTGASQTETKSLANHLGKFIMKLKTKQGTYSPEQETEFKELVQEWNNLNAKIIC